MMGSVSVVIPTRNRPEHVKRLIIELSRQSHRADEIIIVDASDEKDYQEEISTLAGIPLCWMDSIAHVCVQRNIGIRRASSDWVFLCDDDIGLPENYIEEVKKVLEDHPGCGVACGLLMQKEKEVWCYEYPPKSIVGLLWAWIFQLPLWGTLQVKRPSWLVHYFEKKGNHLSKAGWPVLVDFHAPVFTTPYYSLGANIVKREWLLQSPFDESLDPHGIGDNYGVVAGFPEGAMIYVTHATTARHYQSQRNRLDKHISGELRIKALKHFLLSNSCFSPAFQRWFRWSLVGRSLYHLARGEFRSAVLTARRIAGPR